MPFLCNIVANYIDSKMPLTRSSENLSRPDEPIINCFICTESIINESQLFKTSCGHTFHQSCFNTKIANKTVCPVCKQSLRLPSVAVSTESLMDKPSGSNVATKTRSQARKTATSNMSEGDISSPALVSSVAPPLTPDLATIIADAISAASVRQTELIAQISMRQSETLSQVIESGFQKLLSSSAEPHTSRSPILPVQDNTSNLGQQEFQPASTVSGTHSNNRFTSLGTDLRPDRISQIISNWKVRFNGKTALSVEDFIYRTEALTHQTLEGNFELLSRYVSNLFDGSASDWFWRYHKSVPGIRWQELCFALREQFNDDRTDLHIRAAIDRRKQKIGEPFDEFHEAIVSLADKLSSPLRELSLLQILRNNLLPEIQHELLYERIERVAQLRHLVRTREIFLQTIGKPLVNRPHPIPMPRRSVNGIAIEHESSDEDVDSPEVSAVNLLCWNCNATGHRYQDCTAERRVFCYGCGKPDTYKPSCMKCNKHSKNLSARAPSTSARKQMKSTSTNT